MSCVVMHCLALFVTLYDFKGITTQDGPVEDGDIGFDQPSFTTNSNAALATEESAIEVVNIVEPK